MIILILGPERLKKFTRDIMNKLIYILALISSIAYSQSDTIYSSHNNEANALESFINLKYGTNIDIRDTRKIVVYGGDEPYILTHGKIEIVGDLKVIDTMTFRSGSETIYEKDSTLISWWFPKVTKMIAIKTIGNMELKEIGIPFYPKFKAALDITQSSVKLRSILSENCEVLSITVNGLDYPTDLGFNATKISEEEYRHTRLIEGLTSNTIYMAIVEYRSEIGEIIEVGFTFKTLP